MEDKMSDGWKQGTVFMRHVDKAGAGYVESHSCWQMDRFIESQRDEVKKAGSSVEVVTEAEYLAGRRKVA